MMMKTSSWSSLLIALFLASAALSLATSSRPETRELDECLAGCWRQKTAQSQQMSCMGRCAIEYYQKEQPNHGRGWGGRPGGCGGRPGGCGGWGGRPGGCGGRPGGCGGWGGPGWGGWGY